MQHSFLSLLLNHWPGIGTQATSSLNFGANASSPRCYRDELVRKAAATAALVKRAIFYNCLRRLDRSPALFDSHDEQRVNFRGAPHGKHGGQQHGDEKHSHGERVDAYIICLHSI